MLFFLYAWMPFKLLQGHGLERFFDRDQLFFIQGLNVLGVLAFVVACLAVGVKLRGPRAAASRLSKETCRRLLVGAAIAGSIGLMCWCIAIVNVGGFTRAFSNSYGGGYDDSGYIRDGSLLLLVGVLLSISALSAGGPKLASIGIALTFGLPWLVTALLEGRRGPTFALTVVLLMGWYINRTKRPPLLAVAAGGLILGYFVLFLVTNRSNIYLGSDFSNVSTDVGGMVDKPDTGNEFIYGTGTVLSSQRRDHYFWMRRYLAQIMVRPIPTAIWATKYQDFGVPELLYNAGTGEGFGDTLGWQGATGSAPGIIADLWVEVWWFCVPFMAVLGWMYGFVWKRAVTRGGPWASQYVVLSALSIYMVMQTMEAVIFRTLILSIPCWITWRWALAEAKPAKKQFARTPARVAAQSAAAQAVPAQTIVAHTVLANTLAAPNKILQPPAALRRPRALPTWKGAPNV